MIFDIPELVGEIIKRVDDPMTYRNCLLVCREWNKIGQEFRSQKRKEFLVRREYKDIENITHKSTHCPNGKFHGPEETYSDQTLIGQQNWDEGRRIGLNWSKFPDGIAYTPHVNDREYGIGFSDYGFSATVVQYDKGHTKTIRHYLHGKLLSEEIWNSPINFTRIFYSDQQVVGEENYLCGKPHGVHNGKLYLHGYEQPWYTMGGSTIIVLISFLIILVLTAKTGGPILILVLIFTVLLLLYYFSSFISALGRGLRIRLGYEHP